MGKTLYLLRHAKSSWDDANVSDHDRPLSARGARAARRIAGHFRRAHIRPDLVLCSSAVRTQETLGALAPVLDDGPKVHVEAELYGASEYELLARARRVPEAVNAVLIIGHNPGIEDLATYLDDGTNPDVSARFREKFPSGGLVTLVCRSDRWRELTGGSSRAASFVVPRELPDED